MRPVSIRSSDDRKRAKNGHFLTETIPSKLKSYDNFVYKISTSAYTRLKAYQNILS